MPKQYFIITLLLLWAKMIVAQDTIDINMRSSSVIGFVPQDEPSVNNFVIKEIARYDFLNLQRTHLVLGYDLSIRIVDRRREMLLVQSKTDITDVSGDVFYKDFNLKDVLVPDFLAYRLDVIENGDTIAGYEVKNISPGILRTDTLKPFVAGATNELTFSVSGVRFEYTKENIDGYEKRVSAVNDYLAVSTLSAYQLKKAETIDPENTDNLLSCLVRIYDLERYVALTYRMLKRIDFEVPEQRALFVGENLRKLESQLRRLNTLLAQRVATGGTDGKQQILSGAAGVLSQLQLDYLHELGRQTFYFDSVYRLFATFFTGEYPPKGFSEKMEDVLGLPAKIQREFWSMATDIYVVRADSLIAVEKYHEAVVLLESAGSVCGFTHDEDGGLTIYHKLSTAKWGVYDAYLRVAQTAMDAANTVMAARYLGKAADYQKANSEFIATEGFTLDAYEKLAWVCFQQGETGFKNEDYSQALAGYSSALRIYQMLNISDYDEVLLRKIEKSRLLSDN